MIRSIEVIGAALLALALAPPAAEAQSQTKRESTIHARAKHHHTVDKPKDEGRQITVYKGIPFWLTLGNGAGVGYGANYVTSTFNQSSPVEGTFSGYRGRERLINQYDVSGAPLFRF